MSYKSYLTEVTNTFLESGNPLPEDQETYLRENKYKTRYRLYDSNDKKMAQALKKGFSFSKLSATEQAKIWSYIFKNTEYMGVGHLAISHFKSFQIKSNPNLILYWPILKSWVNKIENWAHADMLASLYCDMLSENPTKVYPELKNWSKQKSPWKNRMAIVSLLYYYNPKRTLLPFNKIIILVKPHLKKEHYYLQKAIGWNLRELSRAYPKEYWKFINENLVAISPTAFSTAIEKIPLSKKDSLKKKRKIQRIVK